MSENIATKIQLTAEQMKAYLDSEGTKCPICGSEEVQFVSEIQIDGLYAFVDEQCWSCKTSWKLEFELTLHGICSNGFWNYKERSKM